MARVAMYPGSFDPVTVGHLDVIERGAQLFDELVVAVGHNPAKSYWFDVETRCDFLRQEIRSARVRVVSFSGLLVDAVAREGATVILRGLRALADFDLEFRNGLANRDLAGVETLFLLSDPRHVFVSSSLVKEIAAHGGAMERYVPAAVAEAMRQRRNRAG